MNTNKKNGFLKVAGSMMAVTMLATCVVAGTMAKYTTSSDSLSASADIAKWDIEVGTEKLADLSKLTFNIYDTKPDGGKADDDEVVDDKIAPGTWGYANVAITNAGDVDAEISANYTAGSADLPAGMKVAVLTSEPINASEVDTSETIDKTIKAGETANAYIAFKWEIGDPTNDKNDTPFGTNAASGSADLELGKLSITADQVD